MDELETTEETTTSLGKTVAVEVVHTTAITVGVVIGFAVAGAAVSKVRELRATRIAKKNQTDQD